MREEIENIIEGCIARDRVCQYKLYNMLAPKLRVVCRRYMGSKEEAEDAMQESFIKIFTNLDSFRGDCELAGWARRITVNVLINKLKKNKQMISEQLDEVQTLSSNTDPSSGLNQEYLLKTIEMLSLEKRTVFNLHAIEGYDHKEIGEMLGKRIMENKS